LLISAVPLDDDSLKRELPLVFLRYLGVTATEAKVSVEPQSERVGRA
jgi:hypothetical protein